MKLIELGGERGKGRFVKVDDEWYNYLMQWSWCDDGDGYAVRGQKRKGKTTMIKMHRVVAGAKPGEQVDHINRDVSDNQWLNLRCCSRGVNAQNSRNRSDNTSGFRGVSRYKETKWWGARICWNKKDKLIGQFENKRHAAMAYDMWALTLYGETARTNFKVVKWG